MVMWYDDAKVAQVATDVIAVFKQAAGANADQILKRIADYGVQGRKTALDADMFTSPGPFSNLMSFLVAIPRFGTFMGLCAGRCSLHLGLLFQGNTGSVDMFSGSMFKANNTVPVIPTYNFCP